MLSLFLASGLDDYFKLENNKKLFMKTTEFINMQEKQFCGKFLLKNGDDMFNDEDLYMLLKTMFWFGKVGITKYNNYLLPITVLMDELDVKNNLVSGEGTSSYNFNGSTSGWKNIRQLKRIKISGDDTVVVDYGSILRTPFLECWELARAYGVAWMVYNKNLVMTQKMLVLDKSGSSVERGIINKFKNFKYWISTNEPDYSDDLLDGSIFNKSIGKTIIPNKVGTLQFTSESLIAIKNAIDNIKSEQNEMFGNRNNLNWKRERQITSEIDLLDVFFDSLEKNMKNKMYKLFSQINKIYGTNYEVVTISDFNKETQDKQRKEFQEEYEKVGKDDNDVDDGGKEEVDEKV